MSKSKTRKPVVLETMTKTTVNTGIRNYTVRVWQTACEIGEFHGDTMIQLALVVLADTIGYANINTENIIEALGNMPTVSAIEVLDSDGNGTVAYMEWP